MEILLDKDFIVNIVEITNYNFQGSQAYLRVLSIEQQGNKEVYYQLNMDQVIYFEYFQYQQENEFSMIDIYLEKLCETDHNSLKAIQKEENKDYRVLTCLSPYQGIVIVFNRLVIGSTE